MVTSPIGPRVYKSRVDIVLKCDSRRSPMSEWFTPREHEDLCAPKWCISGARNQQQTGDFIWFESQLRNPRKSLNHQHQFQWKMLMIGSPQISKCWKNLFRDAASSTSGSGKFDEPHVWSNSSLCDAFRAARAATKPQSFVVIQDDQQRKWWIIW